MAEHDLRIEGRYKPVARPLQYSVRSEALAAKDLAEGAYDATLSWSLLVIATSVQNRLKSRRASYE